MMTSFSLMAPPSSQAMSSLEAYFRQSESIQKFETGRGAVSNVLPSAPVVPAAPDPNAAAAPATRA
jgi:hypothetical protein